MPEVCVRGTVFGVRTCCDVGCSAPFVRAGRLGGARVRSAGGHARRGRAGRARWGGRPHGAAMSAAPFGPKIASFVVLFCE